MQATVAITIDAGKVIDAIPATIPGKIDDAVLEILRRAHLAHKAQAPLLGFLASLATSPLVTKVLAPAFANWIAGFFEKRATALEVKAAVTMREGSLKRLDRPSGRKQEAH